MPRRRPSSLAGMSIEALLTLRDDVGRVLSQKTSELREQLQRLELGAARTSTARAARVGSLRGRKISPKYRDPHNRTNVWAGRGAVPRWMQEKIRAGAKRDDFLIGASGRTKRTKKTARKAAKRKTSSRKAKTKTVSKKKRVSGKRKPARTTSTKRQPNAALPQSATVVSPTGSATE